MLKDRFVKDGFEQKAILSKKQMAQFIEAFEAEKGVVSTPPDELLYIERLAELPWAI
jgi:hypothetical protein